VELVDEQRAAVRAVESLPAGGEIVLQGVAAAG
jgi:hypothetical protein